MKKQWFQLIAGVGIILLAGGWIYGHPYREATERNAMEEKAIQDYLEQTMEQEPESNMPVESVRPESGQEKVKENQVFAADTVVSDPGMEERAASSKMPDPIRDTSEYDYKGTIDSVMVIDKINLKKVIIRGKDNNYNLDKYYFVTASQSASLGEDNYVIYGHCSKTYGHSFNRLEELKAGDSFYLIQGDAVYDYIINEVRRELRKDAASYLDTGKDTVQLVSCERQKAKGYSEKRLIIVTAERENRD